MMLLLSIIPLLPLAAALPPHVPRAAPDSPSGGYAPGVVSCPPARPTIRPANSLSQEETAWLSLRRRAMASDLQAFLTAASIPSFDAAAYLANSSLATPTIAIAVSGGGYRALMNGAGFISAADLRTAPAPSAPNQNGGTGGSIAGLLQSTTYLSGLSGGAWLVGSIYANNFSTIQGLQYGSDSGESNIWAFQNNIFDGPDRRGPAVFDTVDYLTELGEAVATKRDAGFDTTLTDYWGRALSYQLVNTTDGGPAYTLSSIASTEPFSSAQCPFPILVADSRAPGTKIISINSTVFEFNSFEMGSWDPTLEGFAPTRFLGSSFANGSIPNNGVCVRGYDQIGFVMGTSSSLFNTFLLQNFTGNPDVPKFLLDAVTAIATSLSNNENDIAVYQPNPFRGFNPAVNPNAGTDQLDLVDGGEDLQNIPLEPLFLPLRGVDVVFAVDSSADTRYNWPNGTAVRATLARAMAPEAVEIPFPQVPDAETFINLGLNQRPTFFGCPAPFFNASPSTSAMVPGSSSSSALGPLLVYLPNAPYTFNSNVSTFDLSYSPEDRNAIILNAFNGATRGNGTLDEQWTACVACAALARSFDRVGVEVPAACASCFARYCWNGTVDSTPVSSYEPTLILGGDGSAGSESAAVGLRVDVSSQVIMGLVSGLAVAMTFVW